MKNRSGVALSGLLLGCLAGLVLSSVLRADTPEQQPKKVQPANPAAQRLEMIQELKAIHQLLAEIHAELRKQGHGGASGG